MNEIDLENCFKDKQHENLDNSWNITDFLRLIIVNMDIFQRRSFHMVGGTFCRSKCRTKQLIDLDRYWNTDFNH
jgi:hypothetical protein